MDREHFKFLLVIVPRLPLIVRAAMMHIFHLSESAPYLDLRSELILAVIRSLLVPSRPRSVTYVQRLTLRDPGVKGNIWVSNYESSPLPDTDTPIRDALIAAMDRLVPGSGGVRVPDLVSVQAEWTGHQADATSETPLPEGVSEAGRYQAMMRECTTKTTILYLHGGAYYLCDPATHRATTEKLAKLTGGRCYSVRYRLAPQHPFPSALLDALVSYFTLLYPPPDAYHEPVRPEDIVIAGDSAGGNLALALLQLIMEIRRSPADSRIMWHGELRDVPLPAGVACNSPWLDITQSSPTWDLSTPTPFDYLPKPEVIAKRTIPPCHLWPANPPRKLLYADDALASHPLASLVMARSWKGAPPIYLCTGWEILGLEDKYFARKLDSEGVTVVLDEYEGMPHCFALILPRNVNSQRCYENWASFISRVVEDPGSVHSRATTIKSMTGDEVPLKFEGLCDMTEEEVRERVLAKAGSNVRVERVGALL